MTEKWQHMPLESFSGEIDITFKVKFYYFAYILST